MSEFLAEARVIVRPDTTKFRAELEAQLKAATKGVTVAIPVAAVPTTTSASTAAVQKAQAEATAEVARASTVATRAMEQQAGVQTELTGTSARLTTAQRAEARATELLALSATQLAEAEALASLKTTQLAASRTRLAASSRAVATAERAVLASFAAENTALTANARATLANAQAQEVLFRERVRNTIAADAHAAAEAREARASALAAKGAGATGLAMAGARGATLAASGSFLIGAAAAVFFAESIKQAIDAEEAFRRTTFLLGDQLATQLADQAEGIGEAFAIDDDDVLKFEVQIGKILKSVQFSDEQIAELSSGVVKLAADMAAFNRVPIDATLKALQTGLAGNTRGLKQFGVVLDAASIKQEALAQTGKDTAAELTQQEIVLARYTLILERAGFQQGAFADQADTLVAQSQRLKVNFEELQEAIGKGLVPAVSGLVKGLNDTFDAFNAAATGAKRFGSALPIVGDEVAGIDLGGLAEDAVRLNVRMITMTPALGAAAFAFEKFGDDAEEAGKKLTFFDKIAGSVGRTLGALAIALEDARSNFPTREQRDELSLTLAQAGGDESGELAILRKREARQEAFLNRVLEQPATTKKIIDLQTRAAKNLDQTRERINSILQQQETDANKAATTAAAARGKADQALLSMLGAEQDRARNQILRAQGTEALGDDIKFHEAFRDLLRKQKDIVAATVKDAQRRAAELTSLTAALLKVGDEIKDLRRRQREALRAAQEERFANLERGVELDIELADINENQRRQIALRQQQIALIRKEIRVLKLQGNALKEKRNEIARIRKEIEDLTNEQKETNNRAAEFFFEQLQAQQGFAANLLGNLITGPTAGLVGVPSPTAPGPRDVGAGVRGEANRAAGQANLGPTAGQQNTEISVLEKILMQLRILNGSYDAPEAINQKKSGGASMDYATM